MNFIDLSHLISGQMSVYPNKNLPTIKKITSISNEGYRETTLSFDSHIGTHIDAPAHMLDNGRYLNQYPISRFTGKALVIEILKDVKHITWDLISKFENELEDTDYILFKTGWSKFWGTDEYFKNFPVLEENTINKLTTYFIKGIGFDAPSVDPTESENWTNHKILFDEDILIIENLIFPESFNYTSGDFFCFPLCFEDAEGAPIRAVFKPY